MTGGWRSGREDGVWHGGDRQGAHEFKENKQREEEDHTPIHIQAITDGGWAVAHGGCRATVANGWLSGCLGRSRRALLSAKKQWKRWVNLMMLFRWPGHGEGERDGCARECHCFYIQVIRDTTLPLFIWTWREALMVVLCCHRMSEHCCCVTGCRIFSVDWRRMGTCAPAIASALRTVQCFALCAFRFPRVLEGHCGLISKRHRQGLGADASTLQN